VVDCRIEQRMSVVEMIMIRWTSGKMGEDRIRNTYEGGMCIESKKK